jgi:hypothetical protein
MATDNDVLHLEVLYGVLNNREGVEICWDDDVGNVAVAEDFAWLESQNGSLGASRVGTSNPENLRSLTLSKFFKEFGFSFLQRSSPGTVVVEGSAVSVIWRYSAVRRMDFWTEGGGLAD